MRRSLSIALLSLLLVACATEGVHPPDQTTTPAHPAIDVEWNTDPSTKIVMLY